MGFIVNTDKYCQVGSATQGIITCRATPAVAHFKDQTDVIYIFGGQNSQGALNDTWKFNLTSKIWYQFEQNIYGNYPKGRY